MPTRDVYIPRIVDRELDDLMRDLPALSIEGPKGVGKTATASRRADTMFRLDHQETLAIVQADSTRLTQGSTPILIDEWQRFPPSWDIVRRSVDDNPAPGRFLLTGSSTTALATTHSGAGRIVRLRMRPQTLAERGIETPSVSLGTFLTGARDSVIGTTAIRLEQYVDEILLGGFPGMRHAEQRTRTRAIDSYLERIIDAELPELGFRVRRPASLRRWLTAYAAATSTTASFETIREAATADESHKPAKTTTIPYRDALERIWILDPVEAWMPTGNRLTRLTGAPKHHLADPCLAARLVGLEREALLRGESPLGITRTDTFVGALFESLAALSLRVFAQSRDAKVHHFRTRGGEHEIDFIVERSDQRIVACEVKLTENVTDTDVRHLRWLAQQMGDRLLDSVVLTTGTHAYRRDDGIAVVPLALLGP